MLIFIFFEMSYFIRFLYDVLREKIYDQGGYFAVFIAFYLVVILEGLSFASLLLMHYKSFKGVKNQRESPPSGSQLYSSVSLSTDSKDDDIEVNSKS